MNKYQFVFLLQPPEIFGLPADGRTVVRADGTPQYGATVDTRTGNAVSHGTISKFRDAPFQKQMMLGSAKARVQDNFLFIDFDEINDGKAISKVMTVTKRLCEILSVETPRRFSFHFIQGTIEPEGTPVLLPPTLNLLNLASYNLDQLDVWMENAGSFFSDSDDVLEQSLAYFYHAMQMFEEINSLDDLHLFQANMLVSETILNFYMAASTIVGDPSKDRDYQSRYKSFGITFDAWSDVEKLRTIRNDDGVAHYSLEPERLKGLYSKIGFARKTARTILLSYMDRESHPKKSG